jgi:hypothetical protein
MPRPDPTDFPWAIRPAAVHLLSLLLLLPLVARGADLPAQAALPVREVSVFKDGHAFVVHHGSVAVDAQGNAVLRHLPAPVMGTFWVGAIDGGAEQRGIGVAAVTASQSRVRVERTALSLKELVDANPGAKVLVTETPPLNHDPAPYEATILPAPVQTSDELESLSPPGDGPKLPVASDLVFLKTDAGTRVLPLARITDITFRDDPAMKLGRDELRSALTLRVIRRGAGDSVEPLAGGAADVGLMYVQRGLRWIPSYRVELDGKGQARVWLQATLVNDLVDLDDVTCNLVVGVPTFALQGSADPIGLEQAAARLAQAVTLDNGNRFGNFYANSMMSQVAGGAGGGAAPAPEADAGGANGEKTEDLYVFRLEHVSLKKGERMVVPVSVGSLPYRDFFKLEISLTPPAEFVQQLDPRQGAEFARLMAAPKAVHTIRLSNTGKAPLTTAPALVMRDGRVLAQGMLSYTSPGAEVDLAVTTAVDIRVTKEEREARRVANAQNWNGEQLARLELTGELTLKNLRGQPVDIEVVRHVFGAVESADHDGVIERVNVLEDLSLLGQAAGPAGPGRGGPAGFGWFNWPPWWRQFNGAARIRWQVRLDPGAETSLGYAWSYYGR